MEPSSATDQRVSVEREVEAMKESTSKLEQEVRMLRVFAQDTLELLKEWREERLGSKPSQTVPAYYGAQDTAGTEKMSMQRIAASAGCYGAMAALPEQKVPSAVGGVTGVNIHNSQGPTNTHGVSRYHQRNMETTSSLDQVQTALVSVEPWNDANRLMIPDVHARARTESLDPPIIMGTRKSERVSCLPQHLAACATIALLCALARDIVEAAKLWHAEVSTRLLNQLFLQSLADPYVFMHREKTKAGKPLFNRGRAYCPSRRITTSNVDSAATGRTGTRA